jgi:hypothetical protein
MRGFAARFRGLSVAELVAVSCWVLAAGALLVRLPFGVSHRDEAFYSAMPYSFLIGNQPYLDELAIHQNAGLLLVPFFRVYLGLTGSADGIILFNRGLYFLCLGLASVAAYRFVRRVAGFGTACWSAAVLLGFGYCNLLALSYNTQGAFGLLCGTLWVASGLLDRKPGPPLFIASLFFLLAVFSYPGLVIAVLPYGVMVLAWLCFKRARQACISGLLGLAAGALVAAVTLGTLACWIGPAKLERLKAFHEAYGYGNVSGLGKLDFYHSAAWNWRYFWLAFAAVFVLTPLACRLLDRGLWLVALTAATACALCYRWCLSAPTLFPTPATPFFTAIPLLAPACVAFNRQWRHGGSLLLLIWAPSVLSMLAVSYTSSNGLSAASLGSLGALLAGIATLGALLEARGRAKPHARRGYALVFALFSATCALLEIHSLYAYAYDDTSVDLKALDTRVSAGPMRGTRTTRGNAEMLVAVDRDLKNLAAGARSLTVFDGFAEGYMSTRLKPRTWCQWIFWGTSLAYRQKLMQETFGRPEQLPDLVLKIRQEPVSRSLWQKYERGRYHLVIDRKQYGYQIFQRNGSSAR